MQVIANGVIAGAGYALMALSVSVMFAPTRFLHVAHGGVFAVSAYVAYWAASVLGAPLQVALVEAVVVGSLLGVMLEVAVFRPLRYRSSSGFGLLLSSLGAYAVLQNLLSLLFGDDTRSLRVTDPVLGATALGARVAPAQAATLASAVACSLVLTVMARHTGWGRALRAISSDPELAQIHGVDTDRTILWAFALGSSLAAVAAVLMALDVDMTPTMGLNALMMGVVAMIIGGVRSIPGIFAGGMLLGLAQHLGVWFIGTEWQDAIAFAVLLVFLIVRPEGIAGRRSASAQIQA